MRAGSTASARPAPKRVIRVRRPGLRSGSSLDRYLSQRFRCHGSAHLQADGIGDPPEVLQVGAIELPRALADPDEVGSQVVVAALLGYEAGEGGLIGQVQGLVTGEHLAGAEVLGETPQPLDEVHGVAHLIQGLQVVPRVLPAPGQVPVLGVVEVRETAIHQGPQVVQGGCRAVVGLHEPPGIGLPLVRCQAVDEVAPVDRHLLAVDLFGEATAGLGVLARDAAQMDHSRAAPMGDEHGHLQQHPQLVLDDGPAAIGEGLRAIAALQQEALPLRGLRQQPLKEVHLLGHHQGRQFAQLRQHGLDGGGVPVDRLLGRRQTPPGIGAPGFLRTRVHVCSLRFHRGTSVVAWG